MIQINRKEDCCGCNACGDVCAHGAISFSVDQEGFWYPHVDADACVNCRLCERVCPMLHLDEAKNFGQREPKTYGAWHKNIAIRFDSTSGGVFSALANAMYKEGGYVSGAVFNEDWTVSNFISNNKKDLPRLRSSKYVESNAEGLYKEIKRLLLAGEKVLACGSPCQMAALRTYLRKDYENLLVVDFVCRATNSPKAYRRYLDMLEEVYGGKIVSIKAKNKDRGWRSLARKVVFDNGKVYYGEGHEDHYRRGYHYNFYERPCCYDCKFKGLPRFSDITLGDFWGIEKVDPSLDDNLGTSLLLVNTDKGQAFLEKIQSRLVIKEYPKEVAIRDNYGPIMGDCCTPPENWDREAMFRDMDTMRFDKLAEKYFPETPPHRGCSWSRKCYRALRSRLRRLKSALRQPMQLWRNWRWAHHPAVRGKLRVLAHCAVDLRPGALVEVTRGELILGRKRNLKSKQETRLLVESGGRLFVDGPRTICYHSDIQVFKGATLRMGKGACNSGLQIVCAQEISIGDDSNIGRDVWIRDNNGGHHVIRPGYSNSAPVRIGNHVWIASNVYIGKGVTIGDGAVIAANSVVTSNVPPRTMVSGNPAKVVAENVTWVY